MIALIQYNVVLLAAAMSIGVITGWWLFGRRPVATEEPEDADPT